MDPRTGAARPAIGAGHSCRPWTGTKAGTFSVSGRDPMTTPQPRDDSSCCPANAGIDHGRDPALGIVEIWRIIPGCIAGALTEH